MHYVKDITEKWKKGQPVSLTDFYGHCVGESLLGPVSLASNFRGTQRQFSENICSEDDLRSRIFGTFFGKILACLPLLGFSNV